MRAEQMTELLLKIQEEERKVREDGQKEYAAEEDAFHNFKLVGDMVRCPHCSKPIGPAATLMVYLLKHIFGILSFLGGHKSQREPVLGRIKDSRLYHALLWGIVEESESSGTTPPDIVWLVTIKNMMPDGQVIKTRLKIPVAFAEDVPTVLDRELRLLRAAGWQLDEIESLADSTDVDSGVGTFWNGKQGEWPPKS